MPSTRDDVRRLADLLIDPYETLDVEIKGWLDIVGNNDHKATLAKAMIALANHGGGFAILGFEQTDQGVAPSPNRPVNLAAYTPDTVNAVVAAYAEPSFHCDVQIATRASTGVTYPIIGVPGGHHVPIKARRDGPNGQIVKQNAYYVRRPGPQSEIPQNAAEWDQLIRRCISNARDSLVDQIRGILAGGIAMESPRSALEETTRWFDTSITRWRELSGGLPANHSVRFPQGYFAVAYSLTGNIADLRGKALLEAIDRGTIRHTGWPEFWVPTRAGIQPYLHDENIECWLGSESDDHGPAHADFWCVSPSGRFFLIRGYQEDEEQSRGIAPGTIFSISTPTWRVGEALLHAAGMAAILGDPAAQITFIAEWMGLRGRRLTNFGSPTRLISDRYTSQQDRARTQLSVQADQVSDMLPELVSRLLISLYESFNFFVLPAELITGELANMRRHRF